MTFYNKFIYIITIGKIKVKCNQTGKVFNVVLSSLSNESGEQLTRNDLTLEQMFCTNHQMERPMMLPSLDLVKVCTKYITFIVYGLIL